MPQQPRIPPIGADVSSLMPIGSDVSALMGGQQTQQQAPPPRSVPGQLLDQTTRMGSQILKNTVEPVKQAVGGLWQATHDPVGAVGRGSEFVRNLFAGLGQAQGEQWTKAQEAAAKGDHVNAALHGGAYLLPIVGPMLDDMQERVRQGQSAEVAGDLFTMLALPALAKRSPAIKVPSLQRLNPTEAQAMNQIASHGVPVTAGQVTGNPLLATASQAAERMTFSGGQAGLNRTAKVEQGLSTIGEQLAAKANPAPATRVSAGEGVQSRLGAQVKAASGEADTAYTALRAIEANSPVRVQTGSETTVGARGAVNRKLIMGDVPMAVDLEAARKTLTPLYERMLRASQLAQPMGAEARALQALDRLMRAEGRYAPLSVVDDALSDLKGVLRSSPDKLGKGAGALRSTVAALDGQVMAAARKAGPDAVNALTTGRAETVRRYAASELKDRLGVEPAQIANRLMAREDTGIGLLRDLAKTAPEAVPEIGRAFLDGLIESATAEGGFKGAQGLLKTWQKMGAETKRTLFAEALKQDANYLTSLDNFFIAADRATRNLNPSGSAWQGGTAMHVLQMATFQNPALSAAIEASGYTASKLLSNPKVVRLLAQGASIPTAGVAAKNATAAAIMKALELGQGPSRAQGAGPQDRYQKWLVDNKVTDADSPESFYDYPAAFKAGASRDGTGHMPSTFKKKGHPNEVVGGFNTRTGERVPGTVQASESELIRMGWDPATAKRLSSKR